MCYGTSGFSTPTTSNTTKNEGFRTDQRASQPIQSHPNMSVKVANVSLKLKQKYYECSN